MKIVFLLLFIFIVFFRISLADELISKFYTSTRAFIDINKNFFKGTSFEDIVELRQRFFARLDWSPYDNLLFAISGKADLNYYWGGFNRGEGQIISWGKTDFSPLDVFSKYDLREGLLFEQELVKIPVFSLRLRKTFDYFSFDLGFEPFWTRPRYKTVGSDWAFLSWSSLQRSTSDKNDIKPLLDGTFNPFVEDFPKADLSSFSTGIWTDFFLEGFDFGFLVFTGYDIFPLPFFDEGFLAGVKRQPGKPEEKLSDISMAEIFSPMISEQKPFITLRPSRFWVLGGGASTEIKGFIVKSDIGFFIDTKFIDDNLLVLPLPALNLAFQIEKEIFNDFFAIPSIRELMVVTEKKLFALGNFNSFPSILIRYVFLDDFEILGGTILDLRPDTATTVRSYSHSAGITYSYKDNMKLSAGFLLLDGERISPFGLLKENSVFSFSFKYIF